MLTNLNIVKSGRIRGEKIQHESHVDCIIWEALDDNDISPELCFCFDENDIDDLEKIIHKLKELKPASYNDHKKTIKSVVKSLFNNKE